MGRSLVFSENEFYHLYHRGVERRRIFFDKVDYKRFTSLLYLANSDTPIHLSNYQGVSLLDIPRGEPLVEIGAWCLMPNHFHLVVKEIRKGGISSFMKKLLTGYSMYFNTKRDRKGVLFDGTFRAEHLNTDNYLKYQYAYLHLNPIAIIDKEWKEKKLKSILRAKEFLFSYPYSSFQDYSGKKRDESHILATKGFPDYFSSFLEFEEMINEWLNFDFNFVNRNIKDTP